jgi:SAM-dependent methyltransferase
MNDEWNSPVLAKEYAEKLDQVDWYEYEVNMPSLLSLIPSNTKSVLDFGSGSGQFTAILAANYKKVEGADISPAMIEIANKAYPDISFRRWDGQSPYDTDQKFDTIFSKLTIHFVKDLAKFAQLSHQLLEDNGQIVLSLPHPIRTIPKADGKYSSVATYNGAIGKYGINVKMIHRSLEDYFKPFLDNGFRLTGLVEPKMSKKQAKQYGSPKEDLHVPKRLNLSFERL